MKNPYLTLSAIAVGLLISAGLTPNAAAQAVQLRTGSFTPPGTPWEGQWLRFKTNIEKASAGSISVDLNMKEPNEATSLGNLRRGRIECSGASMQGAATIVPEIAILQAPYLWSGTEELDYVFDNHVRPHLGKLFAAKGVELIQFVDVGWTNLFGNEAIRSPADIKGVKLRASQSQASQMLLKAIGAEVVPMPIGEVVPSLQTGLVKGGESGVVVYNAVMSKVSQNYTMTQHAYDTGVVICNKAWFDKLSAEQKKAVSAGYGSAASIRKEVRDFTATLELSLKGKGVKIYNPSEAELKLWRGVTQDVPAQMVKAVAGEAQQLMAEIQAGKKDFAAGKR